MPLPNAFAAVVLCLFVSGAYPDFAINERNLKSNERSEPNASGKSFLSGMFSPANLEKFSQFAKYFAEKSPCAKTCRRGVPTPRKGYSPSYNGCGSYGIVIPEWIAPLTTECCKEHDLCYDTCLNEKERCDAEFLKCLDHVCDKLFSTVALSSFRIKGKSANLQLLHWARLSTSWVVRRFCQRNVTHAFVFEDELLASGQRKIALYFFKRLSRQSATFTKSTAFIIDDRSYSDWTTWTPCIRCTQTRRRKCIIRGCRGQTMVQKRSCVLAPGRTCLRTRKVSYSQVDVRPSQSFAQQHGFGYQDWPVRTDARSLFTKTSSSRSKKKDSLTDIRRRRRKQRRKQRRKRKNLMKGQKFKMGAVMTRKFASNQEMFFTTWSQWSKCKRCRKKRVRNCRSDAQEACSGTFIQEKRKCVSGSLCVRELIKETSNSSLWTELKACGLRRRELSLRITGGQESFRGAWPWQVSLVTRHGTHFCGGALISSQYVLTAAHCLWKNGRRRRLKVKVGEHDLTKDEGSEIDYEVAEAFSHPAYNLKTIDADIALIKLKEPVRRSRYVQPVCLPMDVRPPPNSHVCSVAGWGRRNYTDFRGSNVLIDIQIPLVDQMKCKAAFNYALTQNHLCAGYYHGGLDTCPGDSGSPLVCRVKRRKKYRWYVYGVTSFGEGCGRKGKYGVYSKVANFIDWIIPEMSQRSTYRRSF